MSSELQSAVPSPLVSVIISNYNYGQFLADTIQSVLDQTYRRIEIIVVDDGSTDHSHDVLSRFEDMISPLYRDHQGQCAALNAGFNLSHGDIVIFLDSDDCLVADAIERLTRPFRSNIALTKSQGYMNAVNAKGRLLGWTVPYRLSPSGDYKEMVLKYGPSVINQAWTSGNAWARWFIEKVLPLPEDPENKVHPDGCLNPLATLYGSIVTLEKPVGLYRLHEHNIGPFGLEFSAPSLSMELKWKQNAYEFIAQRATNLGLKPSLDQWFKGPAFWKDKLKTYAIFLMDPSQKPPQFQELVFASYKSEGKGILKATVLTVILTVIWFSPRKYALGMIRPLLQLSKR